MSIHEDSISLPQLGQGQSLALGTASPTPNRPAPSPWWRLHCGGSHVVNPCDAPCQLLALDPLLFRRPLFPEVAFWPHNTCAEGKFRTTVQDTQASKRREIVSPDPLTPLVRRWVCRACTTTTPHFCVGLGILRRQVPRKQGN